MIHFMAGIIIMIMIATVVLFIAGFLKILDAFDQLDELKS